MLTPAANPLISFPLSRGKAVETASAHADGDRAGDAQIGIEIEIARLTRGLVAGDEAAFRQFHDRYFDRLYRFLLVVARGQEQEARDALQQTFLRVIKHARAFTEEEAFWCWLKVVARSAARDAGRREHRYSVLLQHFTARLRLDAKPQVAGDEEENCLQVALEESMAEMEPEERALLRAKYIEGSTVREISRDNQLTEKAVEGRLGRARQVLREKVLRKLSRV